MTDFSNESSSRKKYLIPLVVLLLCGAALTSTAFAYSSSNTSSDDIAVKSYEIDVDGADVIVLDDCYLVFDCAKVDGTATYTINSEKAAFKTVTVKIDNANNTAKFKITSATATCDATGISIAVTPSTTEAVSEATLTLTASGTLTGTGSPAASYKVTLVIETVAA